MSFGDEMKRKADEVQLEEKAKALGDAIADLAKSALSAAGGFASENKPKVDEALTKASAKAKERTDGKYAAHIDKAMDQVSRYVDKVATATPGAKKADESVWAFGDSETRSPVQDAAVPDASVPNAPVPDASVPDAPVPDAATPAATTGSAPQTGSATTAAQPDAGPDSWGQATDRP